MKLALKNIGVTPGTDPQDGGFDVFLNYVSTRDPTASEPLIYNNYPWLPLWWQTANTTDSWATYTTSDYWLCVDNTASAMKWQRMVFDANILQVINSVGWQINTARNYAVSGISLNSARRPSLTNDIYVVPSIKQVNTLLTSTSISFDVSPDNSTWTTIGSIGSDTGVVSSYTSMVSFTCPAGYYYRLVSSGTGTVTLVSCTELSQ